MTINNQTNKLTKKDWLYPTKNNTFHFCIEGTNEITIKLTKGIYNIENIEMYTLDNEYIKNINKEIEKFDIIEMNSEKITGTIKSKEDGYLILSIPYDKGFKIKVNNINKNYKLINESFIGLYLEKGEYNIEITYNPPYKNIGILASIIGISLLIGRIIYEKNNSTSTNNTNNNNNDTIHKHKK